MIGVDAEAQQQLAPYLEPGERLLWFGRPRRGLLLRSSDIFAIPFSLAWCGFAIMWEMSALRRGQSAFAAVFGAVFAAIGLYTVVGRFIVDAAIRARTTYGLTNRRAIIQSGLLTRQLSSTFLANLADVTLTERSQGEGTIILGRAVPIWNDRIVAPPSFEAIPDAARVYQLIQKTKADLTRPGQK
jgi:hypothetical protein